MAPRYQIQPLGRWDRPETQDRRSSATFRASWDDTLKLLTSEIEALGGNLAVVQIDADPARIRRDGMLHASAKVYFPGVKVSFNSTFGPLTYATDAYDQWYSSAMPGWQANVRAIALGLQALRAVDRYGITHTGEQYRGFTAISDKPHEETLTVDEAARVLADGAGLDYGFVRRFADVLEDARSPQPFVSEESVTECTRAVGKVFRVAIKNLHHDRPGGSEAATRLLINARDVLLGNAR